MRSSWRAPASDTRSIWRREAEQRVDVVGQIQTLAGPERDGRFGVDRPAPVVGVAQFAAAASRTSRHLHYSAPVRAPEHETGSALRDRVAAIVYEPMMVAAQLHEVVQAGRATVGPVLDV